MYNKKSNIELNKILKREKFKRTTCSFYKYFSIKKPSNFRDRLYTKFEEFQVLGRVYVSNEGINAQISIPDHKLKLLKKYLRSLNGLNDLQFKYAIGSGISFIKLKMLVRDEIVAYKVPKNSYNMKNKGTYLKPIDFHKSIKKKDSLIIDMRNYYESEVGKFKNAIIPNAHCSKELLPKVAKILKGKENKKVHLYCTGGIRCEKASAYLIKKGFKEVFQLEGGIIQYANDIKANNMKSEFIGKNFVFDDRMGERITSDIIGKCHQCKKTSDNHKNCDNIACHILFIQCEECSKKYKDCCSDKCMEFNSLDLDTKKMLRKDKNKKVTSAKLSTKFRPKLYKIFNYWK